MWEKEKMLVTIIFSFSQNCFLLYQEQILSIELPLIYPMQTVSVWTSPKCCGLEKSQHMTSYE